YLLAIIEAHSIAHLQREQLDAVVASQNLYSTPAVPQPHCFGTVGFRTVIANVDSEPLLMAHPVGKVQGCFFTQLANGFVQCASRNAESSEAQPNDQRVTI